VFGEQHELPFGFVFKNKGATRRQRESNGLVPWRAKHAMTNVIVYVAPVKRKKGIN
jgi:hypothetical protein